MFVHGVASLITTGWGGAHVKGDDATVAMVWC